MKSTGIIRKVDELGRIVIPREIRNSLGLKAKDPMEFLVEGDSIILKKYELVCIFCRKSKNLVQFDNKLLCKACIKRLSAEDLID